MHINPTYRHVIGVPHKMQQQEHHLAVHLLVQLPEALGPPCLAATWHAGQLQAMDGTQTAALLYLPVQPLEVSILLCLAAVAYRPASHRSPSCTATGGVDPDLPSSRSIRASCKPWNIDSCRPFWGGIEGLVEAAASCCCSAGRSRRLKLWSRACTPATCVHGRVCVCARGGWGAALNAFHFVFPLASRAEGLCHSALHHQALGQSRDPADNGRAHMPHRLQISSLPSTEAPRKTGVASDRTQAAWASNHQKPKSPPRTCCRHWTGRRPHLASH
eukprot:scaffold89352_cov24-Tisochrysis_lutea.AAC.2